MLKLIYTETDLHMEKLSASLEEWVSQRVLLALRVGTKISVEPTGASFGLSTSLAGWPELEKLIGREASEAVSLSVCDDELIEIGLEGVFVTHLPPIVEKTLLDMWEIFNSRQPVLMTEI
jgi:hypothetical protein